LKDSTFFGNVNEVAVNGATVYVAADKGFFVSIDGGLNFVEEGNSNALNLSATDVKIAKNGDVYYSGGFVSNADKLAGAKTSSTSSVYYAAAAVASAATPTYAIITPTNITNRGRIEIATSPVDPNYVYLSIAKMKTTNGSTVTTGGLSAVMGSNDMGGTWTTISLGTSQFDPLTGNLTGIGKGDYANTIVADPIKKDALYIGGDVVFSWVQITGNNFGQGIWNQIGLNINVPFAVFIHSNVHDIKFNGGNNSMYVATDGGIFKSVSSNSGFLAYSKGLNISQFNSVAYATTPRFTYSVTGSDTTLIPNAGAAGGTIGNSVTYISGSNTNNVQSSNSFGTTDAYQSDFSKVNPSALFYAGGNGTIFRSADISSSPFSTFYDNSYKGAVSTTAGPGTSSFANLNTPMRLWENYTNMDSSIFFNSPAVNIVGNSDNAKTRFSIANIKSQRDQRYEKVTITTSSTKMVGAPANQTITIVPVYNGPYKIVSQIVTGNANTSTVTNNMITLTTNTAIPGDSIRFTFASAPKDSSFINVHVDYSTQTNDNGVTTVLGKNYSSTAQSFKLINTRSKAKYHYTNLNITVVSTKLVAPPATQTINFAIGNYGYVPSIHRDSISVFTQTLTGSPSSDLSSVFNNLVVVNNKLVKDTTISKTNYLTKDTIYLKFLTPPDSCQFNLTADFITNDSIIIKNTDVSGYNFETGELTTSYTSTSVTPTPLKKYPLRYSARLAVGTNSSTSTNSGNQVAVYAVKRPLNFSVNPDWVKIAGKNARADSANGTPYLASSTGTQVPNSLTTSPILGSTVTRLEWAPNGECIYFSTASTSTASPSTYYLYRVSHLQFIGDSAAADYSGNFSSDLDSGSVMRKGVLQRTTPLGKFTSPITGIAISGDNANVMVTCGGYFNSTGSVYYTNADARTLPANTTDASNFSVKSTGLPMIPVYTGIFEMTDNKRAIIGTESGIYSTMDITQGTPSWVKESGGNFPNVPVFQIRQQTYPSYKCYNSGVIYAATHGRGIWSTDKYFTPYAIGIQEQEKADLNFSTNIRLYPNPASDATNVWFKAVDNTSYKLHVYDINGRLMLEQITGKLQGGEQVISINTGNLTSGVYFVSVVGSNSSSVNTKLVITH
jgi:hypothetical protein